MRTLLERWHRTLRFAYVLHLDGAEPLAVQATAQALLAALEGFWRHPGWEALHQSLEEYPELPLCLEIPPAPVASAPADHPLLLADQLPWESLLREERPIWRVRSITARPPSRLARPRWRRPRLLLINGPSEGLQIQEQVGHLMALQGSGRIELEVLRNEGSSVDTALDRLRNDPQGWDGLIYLGHGESSPQSVAGLRLERGLLAGRALVDALRLATPQLVLLSRCHGTDLIPLCLEAGVPWVLAFRGEVPDPIALAAFAPFWQALLEGSSLLEATTQARHVLERTHPGSSPLLSLVGRVNAEPLRLPLRRRHLWWKRLAHSQRRQLVATGAALGVGLLAYGPGWGAGHPLGMPNALLEFRLEAQTAWRDLRAAPSAPPKDTRPSPLVVWLLSRGLAYPHQSERVSRQALVSVLQALPPERAPVVGIDVVLEETADPPLQADATQALAALIQVQRRPELFNIHVPVRSRRPGAVGEASRPSPILQRSGLRSTSASLGIPEDSPELRLQDFPLQLIEAVGPGTFAWTLAQGGGGAPPRGGLPAGSVIDWSVDWFAPSVMRIVRIGSLPPAAPLPPGARVLVGVDPRSEARGNAPGAQPEPGLDLFEVPAALSAQSSRRTASRTPTSWLNAAEEKELPGALLQAVWAESLRRGYWLTPLAPLPTMTLAAGLGVLLAAALERRRQRFLALAMLSLLAVPAALELALGLRLLVPLLFPLGALWASCLSRREREG
ncbi:MAG: CHAT domain-containing protein [Synechococcus sp.]